MEGFEPVFQSSHILSGKVHRAACGYLGAMPDRRSRASGMVDVLSKDAIPSIDEPAFTRDPDIADHTPVVGVALEDGPARAYPVAILNWHEIVNDEIGGTPLAVTYCPLCGTGIAYDRRVDEEVLEFGVSGRLYKNDLVMYDRQTGSHWVQLVGRAVEGALEGTELRPVPTDVMTWGRWRERHPDAEVLVPPEGPRRYADDEIDYGEDPHGSYARDHDDIRFPRDHVDDRLPAKTLVAGLVPPDGPVAVPLEDLDDPGSLSLDEILLVRLDGRLRAWRTQGRWALKDGELVDDEDRRVDALTGRGDAALERVPVRVAYWFAWADFFPETRIQAP